MFEYNVLITTRKQNDIYELQLLVENKRVDGIVLTRSIEVDKALQYLTDMHFPTAITGACQYENVIRLRLWNNPENVEESKGYCNLADTIVMAKRIKAHQMSFMLDFHYSDFWLWANAKISTFFVIFLSARRYIVSLVCEVSPRTIKIKKGVMML